MSRAGSTLLELLVALAVIGVALGVAVVAFRAEPPPDAAERRVRAIAAARREALTGGRPVVVALDGGAVEGIAYPDGRVLLPDSAAVEPMSGRPDAR
jgi:prepilin-type N-terminal cleavage/methylation domain-containing protein